LARIICVTTSPYPYGDNITDGPGYRAYSLFQKLRSKHEITILSLYESFHLNKLDESRYLEDGIQIRTIKYTPSRVAKAIREENPDVIYVPWSALPFLSRFKEKLPTIIDYVGSGLLEELATTGRVPAHLLKLTLDSFWRGDFLITSGARFRLFILAMLIAAKKVTLKSTTPTDPLIHLVPMALPPGQLPIRSPNGMDSKCIHLLIAGAILPWYDYPTVFEALDQLSREGLDYEMVLMGGNPRNLPFEKSVRARAEALGDRVHFTGVVPFRRRAEFYQRTDVGLNIAKPTLEDELSIRTRIFDYLWGGLPVVTCGKDEYSDLVIQEGAGFRYEAGDPGDLASKLLHLTGAKELMAKTSAGVSRVRSIIENDSAGPQDLERFLNDPYTDPNRNSTARIVSSAAITFKDYLRSISG